MVTITQEGNLSMPQSNLLFQDVKFWFSMMVPGRNNLISSVRANGGKVVLAERDADVCIIDHKRPPNLMNVDSDKKMYSYRLIAGSIARGKFSPKDAIAHLVELTKTPAHQVTATGTGRTATVQAVGRRKGAKRNNFSPQEDLILFHYLSRPGVPLSGNKVYQKLAADHPSHSFHGWRGRWLDQYSRKNSDPLYWYEKLKKNGIVEDEETEVGELEVLRRSPPEQKLQPSRHPPLESTEEFTNQDDRILEEFHKTVEEAADPLEVWEWLEEQHPQHRASRWRKRYNEVVFPSLKRRTASAPHDVPEIPGPGLRNTHSPHPQPLKDTSASSESGQRRPSFSVIKPRSSPAAKPQLSPVASAATSPTLKPKLGFQASTQSSEEFVRRWRVQVGPLHPGMAPPVVSQPGTSCKRQRSGSYHTLPPDAEIPSTPPLGPPSKRLQCREPSPELGSSYLPVVTASTPAAEPSFPHPEEDPDLTIPPLNISSSSSFSSDSSRESSPNPEQFFSSLLAKYPGLTEERIVWALRRAGADEDLAEAVIAAEHNGDGFPDLPGVWSEEDDAVLTGRDFYAIAALEKRKDDCMERLEFLREWVEQLE